MKKYNLITPEGTRDFLFEECLARREVDKKLCAIYASRGYTEVITPCLEFYDVFNSTNRYFAQESMYKLTDAKGRLMVLRPDSTLPISRLVATRLRGEIKPLKMYYSQNIYRVNPKDSGRDDEIAQSGIEIIGGNPERSDMEALSIAVEVLSSIDESYRFEIGDSAFFKLLAEKICISDEDIEDVKQFVETKNYPSLGNILEKYGNNNYTSAMKMLPRLFGGEEVFEKAEQVFTDKEALDVLKYLKKVYNMLCELGIKEHIAIDLGFVSKTNYYTGIIFRGYVEGYGKSILSGGRYDSLICENGSGVKSIGFAVNTNAAADVLVKSGKSALLPVCDVLVFAENDNLVAAIRHCSKLASDGMTVDNAAVSDFDEAKAYALAKGIKRIDVVSENGIKTVNL